MTFTIPTWLLWALGLLVGIPALLAIIALAVFGYVALTAIGRGPWK